MVQKIKRTSTKGSSYTTKTAPPKKKEFTYQVGGKTYVQRPLVLGQMQQLMALLRGASIPDGSIQGLLEAFGDKLPDALAIVLIADGTDVRDKDISELAAELAATADLETSIEVIEDFFTLTPAVSLSARLAGLMGKMTGLTPQTAESAN
ncbi:MAG TPA: hypothetical protein VLH56_10185 [Dissulfurispiraceae bacterium]|nr:hypothetical protein [Dissulfurispiraceae bacterium]